MPAIDMKLAAPEVDIQRPEWREEEVVPRRLYLKSKDFEKHGITDGCKGCVAMLRGNRGIPHSESCRRRLTEEIAKTEEGKERVRAAEQRVKEFREGERAKPSSGEPREKRSRTDRSGMGAGIEQQGVDGGQMDVSEPATGGDGDQHGGEKRSQERIELGAQSKRARAASFNDGALAAGRDSDGDEIMEVACQDDFEEAAEFGEEEHEEWGLKGFTDDRTGKPLDPEKVRAAREEEIKELERRVYVEVDVEECWQSKGRGPIGVRWVDVDKGFGVHRSRLVARDFRPKSKANDREGLYAATPPLELVKFLLMKAAMRCKRGEVRKVMLLDISKAHLYAPIEGEEFVDLPPERAKQGKCAKLLYTLYGLRTAASSWEKAYSGTLEKSGFRPGSASTCTFFHPEKEIRIVVHGDDFIVEGREEDLQWTRKVLESEYLVKMRALLGPERSDDKVADVLNRVVEWKDDEFWYEADPRHVETMLSDMGMSDCKAGLLPGAKGQGEGESDEELDAITAWRYRSVVARANFLAQDRPDIRYSVKELCREMSCPTTRSWRALKKLCRYLKRVPRLVQTVKIGTDESDCLEVYVDSDWAGCSRTRKSTNGGCIVWNGACLKTWSTTQTVVAMSSGEAEYYAAVRGGAEGLAMQSMCRDLGVELRIRIHTDSTACHGICGRTGIGKVKHMAVSLLWLQGMVRSQKIRIVKIPGKDNPADLFAKYLGLDLIARNLSFLGFQSADGRTHQIDAI